MAKGNPNDQSMQINFTPKAWDEKAKAYKPLYIAPDATATVRGDVFLSDELNSDDNAATGVTAATPKAVKQVYTEAKNKVSKVGADTQSIESSLIPALNNIQNLGSTSNKWKTVYATTFEGNATSASKLATKRTIKIINGTTDGTTENSVSDTFDGSANLTLNLDGIDASKIQYNQLPLHVIPKAALERLIVVANQTARFALTTNEVQLGDVVLQEDTKIMYYVVDEAKLNQAAGYKEFTAATAARATQLTESRTFITDLSSTTPGTFDGTSNVTLGITGQLLTANIADQAITFAKLDNNINTLYIGSTQPTDNHIKLWIDTKD